MAQRELRKLVKAAKDQQEATADALGLVENPQGKELANMAKARAEAFDSVLRAMDGCTTDLRLWGE